MVNLEEVLKEYSFQKYILMMVYSCEVCVVQVVIFNLGVNKLM